ncbi:RIO kinase 1 [Paraburkholderia sp. UCT70]
MKSMTVVPLEAAFNIAPAQTSVPGRGRSAAASGERLGAAAAMHLRRKICAASSSPSLIIRHDSIHFPRSKLTSGATGHPIHRFVHRTYISGLFVIHARGVHAPRAAPGGRMKMPKRLAPLLEEGLIDEVIGQLMSGKEATVYVVRSGNSTRCAKVYKDAKQRSFRQAASYRDGRKVKNSRQARAMEKGTRYGRQMQEASWQNAEVDALFRLADAGVRVPQPYICTDGVLLMELVVDGLGDVAPRLNDVDLTEARALELHALLLNQVVRMLCAGVIHGDLSEYNILLAADGPVIIDLPQAVDAAGNNDAAAILKRDVDNLAAYFGRFAPEILTASYGTEIWTLFEAGRLHVDAVLTGHIEVDTRVVDLDGVLQEIEATRLEEDARLRRQQELSAG